MNVFQIRANIIEEIFKDTVHNQYNNEVLVFCPNGCHATKRKLSINVEKNTGKCWVCPEERGSIFFFLKKYATRSQKQRYLDTLNFTLDPIHQRENVLSLPEGYEFILDSSKSPLGTIGLKWAKSKKISKKAMLQYKIGVCSEGFYRDRIIFPSFSKNGILNYFISRRVDNSSFQKYLDCRGVSKKDIIFNELLIDWTSPLILVENVRTPLIHHSMNNIVPILGSERIDQNYKIFKEIVLSGQDKVFICLDPDARDKSLAIAENFRKFGIVAHNVFLNQQVDEVSTEKFSQAIKQSKPIEKDSFLVRRIMNL